MKASLWLLLPLFGIFLFAKEDHSSLISKRELPSGRTIASGQSSKCMRDLFTVEDLKKEVKELENQLDTNRISGQWRHLDLSQLPTPAANFIRKFGDKLGDKSGIDASSCSDVPCLFNTVYGTPDGIAGYVHYLWFLRTGSYLSADDSIPDQSSPTRGNYNGRNFSVSSYLYNDDELYGFWRLGKAIKAPHTNLTYLKEIQRIPRGENFEGQPTSACGLAHSDGWITLTDKCLIVYPLSDSGYLFISVLHEMSHQLDFEEGLRTNDDFYRSQKEDFLNLTGFELLEYRNKAGQTVRQWNMKPGSTAVTPYARTTPAEGFAELLGYFRFDADKTKSTINKELFDFAKKYFQGKSFENQVQADRWIENATRRRTRDILKTFVTCSDHECIRSAIDALTLEEMGKFRSEEADGCRVLSDPFIGQGMANKLKRNFISASESLQPLIAEPSVKETIMADFEEIMAPAVAYESFFSCHSSGSECYAQKLIEKKTPQLEKYGELAGDLLATYDATFPWEDISTEVRSFYQSLLSSRDGVMKIKADELWESCKKVPNSDSASPTGDDYLVRDGYMVSSFYNCLNLNYQTAINGTIDAVKLQEFSARNPEERSFLVSLIRPRFTEILDEKLKTARIKETKYRDAFTEQQGQWLHSTIRSNRFWRPRGPVDQSSLEEACKAGAMKMIGGEVYFHLKKDLYKDLLEKTCRNIR